MTYRPPPHIKLTKNEARWLQQIPLSLEHVDDWSSVAEAMESLFNALLERDAIPAIRLLVFTDPQYAEMRGRAPKQVLESNGTCGGDICRHPCFAKYLRYFIQGPDLPDAAINGFCRILNEDCGTSGMVLKQLHQYVRSCVREYALNRRLAASAFYRLAVEMEIDHDPHSIRAAALSARSTRLG